MVQVDKNLLNVSSIFNQPRKSQWREQISCLLPDNLIKSEFTTSKK